MSAKPGPLRDECSGYCVVCGKWGRGTYAATLNSHSDSIRDHIGCTGVRADGIRSRHRQEGPR
ncbi:hypothetical protein ACIQOW_03810 [Kitasatospora sp. NPDC091335]|uniref:hypothetical protein n=1 Tax=Kitasatospora sp. NPDC091335 TaxID=3364085 RepID=UPI0037F32CBB